MTPRTLGYRTDLIFHRASGVVAEREGYRLIRTPENPGYHWGNFLLFGGAPRAGDLPRWLALSEHELGAPEALGHLVFGWDSLELGEVEPFLALGMRLERGIVMVAERLAPPKPNREAELRALRSEADFEAAIALQTLIGLQDGYEEAGYREFRARKMAAYHRMIEAGRGQWFGAFVAGELAADLGLFWEGGLGRFQAVATHPGYRRRGLAGSLLAYAAAQGRAQAGPLRLVIVADEAYFAKDLYRALGFVAAEPQWGLGWHAGLGPLRR